ncbi:MAG: hypothetical protein H6706_19750 [Myxococcales bacterium]|nr:hypothetical protein [Myxococcales bacterium]
MERAGYSLNVGGKGRRKLEDVLDKEERRSIRAWSGGHIGQKGPKRGRVPRNAAAVREVLERLLRPAPDLAVDAEVLLAELEELLRNRTAEPSDPIPQTDHARVVRCLGRFISQGFRLADEVLVEVITSASRSHATTAACVVPVLDFCRGLVDPARAVVIRVVERGRPIPIQPIARLNEVQARNIRACRVGLDHASAPVWHGTVVSACSSDGVVPVGAIFGWKGDYHVRERQGALDHHVERELEERRAEFERVWSASEAEARTWTPSLPEEFGRWDQPDDFGG